VNVFFASQDPTTPNQGPDRVLPYRSIAFIEMQKRKKILRIKLKANKVFANTVTEVKPLTDFYEAEDYHQDYVKNNPNQPYVKAFQYRDTTSLKTYKGVKT
jgi:peptide-methionine (S)-S-oxide reductase